tara:strand:- start:136 stop:582 length:447 start_codon:yes stop_codon:yes gene_type:complete
MLDNKFFRKIAAEVVKEYRKYIFDPAGGGSKAKQVDGKSYGQYTSQYNKAKKSKKIKRISSKFSQSNAPVLSGDLLNDFQFVKYLINGFTFGFPTQGAKVKQLAKLKRVISSESKPIPKPVEKFVLKEADKYVRKELGKIKGGTFNIG